MKPDVIDGEVFCKTRHHNLASIRIYVPPWRDGAIAVVSNTGNFRHGGVGTTIIGSERTADD